MSTRGQFTFMDEKNCEHYHIYKQSDTYILGALRSIINALPYSFGLERFEASEFACAFIAANKSNRHQRLAEAASKAIDAQLKDIPYTSLSEHTIQLDIDWTMMPKPINQGGGEVYMLGTSHNWQDFAKLGIEYHYEVYSMRERIMVCGYSVNSHFNKEYGIQYTQTQLFDRALKDFIDMSNNDLKLFEDNIVNTIED